MAINFLLSPLHHLYEKNKAWPWTDECEQTFNLLKHHLISASILRLPTFSQDFILEVDAIGPPFPCWPCHRSSSPRLQSLQSWTNSKERGRNSLEISFPRHCVWGCWISFRPSTSANLLVQMLLHHLHQLLLDSEAKSSIKHSWYLAHQPELYRRWWYSLNKVNTSCNPLICLPVLFCLQTPLVLQHIAPAVPLVVAYECCCKNR